MKILQIPITFILLISILLLNSCKKEKTNETDNTVQNSFFAQLIGGSYDMDMAVDNNNNIYLTGGTRSRAANESFDLGGIAMTSRGNTDAFIIKYNQKGKALWAKVLGSKNDEESVAIAVDDDENVYVAGNFRTSAIIRDTELKIKKLNNSSGMPNMIDMFLAKFDKNGNQIWAKHIAGVGYERPTSMIVDENGKIFITGYFDTGIYFDETLYPVNGYAFFIACYNPTGILDWAKTYGSVDTYSN